MPDNETHLQDIVLRQSTLAPYLVGFTRHGFWRSSEELANCENQFRKDNAEVARRIVACWNAFSGVPTEQIEKNGVNV